MKRRQKSTEYEQQDEPSISSLREEEVFETEEEEHEENPLETTVHSFLATPEGDEEFELYTQNLGSISKKYIKQIFKDNPGKIDHVYGPYFKNDKLMIGNSEFDLSGDDKIVLKTPNGTTRYQATPGLFELLVSSNPSDNITMKLIYLNTEK